MADKNDLNKAILSQECFNARGAIKTIGSNIRDLMTCPDFLDDWVEDYPGQYGEMKANIMLAYRHLEDARMRVGKILQAAGDGVSIFDKEKG